MRALRPDPVDDAVVMKCTQLAAGQAAELERVADRGAVGLDLCLNGRAALGPLLLTVGPVVGRVRAGQARRLSDGCGSARFRAQKKVEASAAAKPYPTRARIIHDVISDLLIAPTPE